MKEMLQTMLKSRWEFRFAVKIVLDMDGKKKNVRWVQWFSALVSMLEAKKVKSQADFLKARGRAMHMIKQALRLGTLVRGLSSFG